MSWAFLELALLTGTWLAVIGLLCATKLFGR